MRALSALAVLAASTLVLIACGQATSPIRAGEDRSTVAPRDPGPGQPTTTDPATGLPRGYRPNPNDPGLSPERPPASRPIDCSSLPPQERTPDGRPIYDSSTPTACIGAVGPVTAETSMTACNAVWSDLMGHWTSMTGRPRAEIEDYMRRGLNACRTLNAAIAANPSSATPECARYAQTAEQALTRFTTDVDLTNGAQSDESFSLVSQVRSARQACGGD